jgi:hypothetical protein
MIATPCGEPNDGPNPANADIIFSCSCTARCVSGEEVARVLRKEHPRPSLACNQAPQTDRGLPFNGRPLAAMTIKIEFVGRLLRTNRQTGARAKSVSVFFSGTGNLKRLIGGAGLKLGNFSFNLDNNVAHAFFLSLCRRTPAFGFRWESWNGPPQGIRSSGAQRVKSAPLDVLCLGIRPRTAWGSRA